MAAREDARLTHPNYTLVEANAAYIIALSYLVDHPGDRAGALKTTSDWLAQEKARMRDAASPSAKEAVAVDTVQEWLKEAMGTGYIACAPEITDARIAFVLAFRHLHLGTSFEQAMRA